MHACMCAVVPDVLGNHEDLDSLELLAFPLLLDFLVHQSNQPAQLYPIGGEEQMGVSRVSREVGVISSCQ